MSQILAREDASGERAIGDKSQAIPFADREDLHLDLPVQKVIFVLDAGKSHSLKTIATPKPFDNRGWIEIGTSKEPYFPLAD